MIRVPEAQGGEARTPWGGTPVPCLPPGSPLASQLRDVPERAGPGQPDPRTPPGAPLFTQGTDCTGAAPDAPHPGFPAKARCDRATGHGPGFGWWVPGRAPARALAQGAPRVRRLLTTSPPVLKGSPMRRLFPGSGRFPCRPSCPASPPMSQGPPLGPAEGQARGRVVLAPAPHSTAGNRAAGPAAPTLHPAINPP